MPYRTCAERRREGTGRDTVDGRLHGRPGDGLGPDPRPARHQPVPAAERHAEPDPSPGAGRGHRGAGRAQRVHPDRARVTHADATRRGAVGGGRPRHPCPPRRCWTHEGGRTARGRGGGGPPAPPGGGSVGGGRGGSFWPRRCGGSTSPTTAAGRRPIVTVQPLTVPVRTGPRGNAQ